METKPSIIIKGLSKRYDGSSTYALKNLTLQVHAGEVYGFLGPNGAGKSTTIRLLMNFLQPTAGGAEILGQDVVRDTVAIEKSVGYLPGDFAIYPKLTGKQLLAYLSQIQGSGSHTYGHELAKRLRADLGKRMGDLSRGNRQKIGIIQAMMHKPRVLILDEPTSGLDPLMQEEFYALISEAKQQGAAVFTSSHILSEVQKMCDRVGIIRDGELVAERSIGEMVQAAAHTLDITFAAKPPLAELRRVTGLKVQSTNDNLVSVQLQGKLSDLFAVLARHDVVAIDARNLDLEDMFMKFYEETGGKQ